LTALRKLGRKRDEIIGGWRKLRNGEAWNREIHTGFLGVGAE
jgi:hypothetical protein